MTSTYLYSMDHDHMINAGDDIRSHDEVGLSQLVASIYVIFRWVMKFNTFKWDVNYH